MTDYPEDEDGTVLAGIAAEGVDMSLPLLIEFFVSVPNEMSAHSCLKAVNKAGYRSRVDFDEGEPDFDSEIDDADEFGPSWTVSVEIRMVPEYNEIIRIQAELDHIGQPFGGKSDGWGVMFEGGDDTLVG